ncbi:4-oxalomesaconate tautomerase [Candidatus Poriferisodalis sp.]|uniref:4-oxalomesaconate tautomerase n=1 Tax=Candidatus Poriferisodalis sp. TaxID=3101277 RepID=UPI003AF6A477
MSLGSLGLPTQQRSIPCVLMRGGTSRGPYFLADDLPTDLDVRDAVLLMVMGSPQGRQIDGLGGGTTVTSKVAVVGPSSHPDADVDYLFAQIDPVWGTVDTKPTCGNMLAGVGPFAIEYGLVPAGDPTTSLVVRNVNTDSFIDVVCQTPGGEVSYDGDCAIDGVDGTAAPIELRFRGIEGSVTGSMLPTGRTSEVVPVASRRTDGPTEVEVTLIDVAMPMVLARALDLGCTGRETPDELESDSAFMALMEAIRREAGARMGLGDVSQSVVPKFGMLSEPLHGGTIASRYFTPTQCHPTHAVSGAICVAAASVMVGTVAASLAALAAGQPDGTGAAVGGVPVDIAIEHPSGTFDVSLLAERLADGVRIHAGGVTRTARKIMAGMAYVPIDIWPA